MVGIFDSGTGGLSVLKELRKALPDEKFLYFSDNANCPYGDKSAEEIQQRCAKITKLLLSKGADLIVVACNTATSAAISYLRETFAPVPFVGMEPAVKPAALGTKSGVIGVLATAGTLKGSKYLINKSHFKDNVRIVESVGRSFVELVESGELEGPHAEEVCRDSLLPLLQQGADRIVLGCTHYPFLRATLEKVAAEEFPGKEIIFIDPAPAVAKRAKQLLATVGERIPIFEVKEEAANTLCFKDVELMSSGDITTLASTFEKLK